MLFFTVRSLEVLRHQAILCLFNCVKFFFHAVSIILRILSYRLANFWNENCSKRLFSSDHAVMNKIACEVSIFYLYYDWINLLYCSKRVILLQSQRSGQKKSILARKETIREQQNSFWDRCLKPFFMGKKTKESFFATGSREDCYGRQRHWPTEFASVKPCFLKICSKIS